MGVRMTRIAVFGACMSLAASLGAQKPLDPIEGKWVGTAGTALDRIEIAFDIKRDSTGQLKMFLYQPVGNYYGLELPGALIADSGKYLLRDYRLTLVPKAQ